MRAFLRTAFSNWGLPEGLRLDNGSPWGTQSDIPSALALWMVGLGLQVFFNRPYQSTDNAVVERSHGTLAKWLEPERAKTCAELQKELDWAMKMQRERYPFAAGKSRLELYPQLMQGRKSYQAELEAELWQMEAVLAYLDKRIWQRRVDKVGRISFFSHAYSVGRAQTGKSVSIRLEAQSRAWLIEDEQGKLLKRYPAKEICPERIWSLSLSKRSKSMSQESG